MQVRRHVNQPVLVSLRLADVDGAAGEIDITPGQPAGLARPQPQAVDHPEHGRDDQMPSPTVGRRRYAVSGSEDRPQLLRGEDVGPVVDLPARDTRRDGIGDLAKTGDVFGQLPNRGDPPHLAVDVFPGPGGGPRHRHLAAE